MLGRASLGISAGARSLLGTGDGAVGLEGPVQVPDGRVCALSSLPLWHSRGAEQRPCLEGGKMPHVRGRDTAEGKAAWSLQDSGEKPSSPGSGFQATRGFSFHRALLLPV